ncbi:glycosyltransferase [Burkholderia cenocepacia]|uniref:glycosyltransferase n=1 Tax=Burkholderia cenocepacia TaxID=95486 RepID=UPI001BAA5418|nr:glycosyltransferase [Burkholderia cenocepacia]QUN43988.1 glycosyltransferase [Burkholderia cenocepacia]
MATVSVIVPFFNQLKYLRQCLESVLTQTFEDIEVLLVNDGSEEDPAELVQALGDPRIKLIVQANAGVAIARNNAIAASSGKFLVFLDADDWLAPTMVEEMSQALIGDNDAGMAYCDIVRVNEQGEVADAHKVAHARAELNGNILPSLMLGGYFPPVCVMVRASALDTVGGFDKLLGGCCDWDLWIRIVASGFTARFVPRELGYYRLHGQSMSKDSAHMRSTAEATLAKNMAAFPQQLAGAMQLLIQTSAEIYSTNIALEQERLRLIGSRREHERDIERLEGIVSQLKDDIGSLMRGKQWLEEQWSNYKAANVAMEQDKQHLSAALAEHRSEIERLEATTRKLKSDINELTTGKQWLEKRLDECRRINAATELDNQKLTVSLAQQKAETGFIPRRSPQTGSGTSTMLIDRFRAARQRVVRLARRFTESSDVSVDEAAMLRTSPLFDGAYYLATYPDVADATIDPVVHYLQFGWREARQPSMSFDGNRYLDDYPDVRAADVNPLVHYLAFGKQEGRRATPVTGLTTGLANPDGEQRDSGVGNAQYSPQEARQIIEQSGLFDLELYCRLNPDLASLPDPLEHYVRHGGFEGAPCPSVLRRALVHVGLPGRRGEWNASARPLHDDWPARRASRWAARPRPRYHREDGRRSRRTGTHNPARLCFCGARIARHQLWRTVVVRYRCVAKAFRFVTLRVRAYRVRAMAGARRCRPCRGECRSCEHSGKRYRLYSDRVDRLRPYRCNRMAAGRHARACAVRNRAIADARGPNPVGGVADLGVASEVGHERQ